MDFSRLPNTVVALDFTDPPVTLDSAGYPDYPIEGEVVDSVRTSPEEEAEEDDSLPALTPEEDDFALAFVQSGGNLQSAYRMAVNPEEHYAKAKGLIIAGRRNVQARIKAIAAAVDDSVLISMGAHLNELAEIRDLGKARGELKVALDAEVKRGEVTGLYVKHAAAAKGGMQQGATTVQIAFVSKHDNNI
jgi:phage terminase small subunit